jgi:hypothetical protein
MDSGGSVLGGIGSVALRMSENAVEDLKRIALTLGFAGYQLLIRAYIGEGLRMDLARLDEGSVPRLLASFKGKGVADSLIQPALAETDQATQRKTLACATGRRSPSRSIMGCAKAVENCV